MLTKLDSAVLNLMDIIDMEDEEVPSHAAREELCVRPTCPSSNGNSIECNSFIFRASVTFFIENRILDILWSYFLSNYNSASCLKNYAALSLTSLSSSMPLPLTAGLHSILCDFYVHVSFSYRNELFRLTSPLVTPSQLVICATPMDQSSHNRLGRDLSRKQELKTVEFTPSSQRVVAGHLIMSKVPRSILKKRPRGEGEVLISPERQHMKRVRFDSSSSDTSMPLKQLSCRHDSGAGNTIGRKRVCIRQQSTPLHFEKKRMLESINCRYHQLISMELCHEGEGGGRGRVICMPLLVDNDWREGGVVNDPIGVTAAAVDDDEEEEGSVAGTRHDLQLFEDSVDAGLKLMHCVTLNTFKNSAHSSHQLVTGRSAATVVSVGRGGLVDRRIAVQSVVSHADVDLDALAITSPTFTNINSSSSPYNRASSDSPSSETSSTCSDDEFYRMFDDALQ